MREAGAEGGEAKPQDICININCVPEDVPLAAVCIEIGLAKRFGRRARP